MQCRELDMTANTQDIQKYPPPMSLFDLANVNAATSASTSQWDEQARISASDMAMLDEFLVNFGDYIPQEGFN